MNLPLSQQYKIWNYLLDFFKKNKLGQYLKKQELDFIESVLPHFVAERVLHLGVHDEILEKIEMKSENQICLHQSHLINLINQKKKPDIFATHLAMPYHENLFDMIILSHYFELITPNNQKLEYRIFLKEIARILKPNGIVILLGFNPYSLWRLRAFEMGKINFINNALSLSELKLLVSEANLQIIEGRFMNYLPPVFSSQLIDLFGFLEKVGNRWYPHGSAVYGLVIRKNVIKINPLNQENHLFNLEILLEPNLGLTKNQN